MQTRLQLRDERRVRRGVDVLQLVGVRFQVVELTRSGLVLHVKVLSCPHRLVAGYAASALLLPVANLERRAPRGWGGLRVPIDQGDERAAIHEGWRCHAGPAGEGRGEVVVEDHIAPRDPCRYAGTPDHQRYPYIFLVGIVLAEL